jgi:pSer/pThr/pTyr-binding forkhead associated (FHA) protein
MIRGPGWPDWLVSLFHRSRNMTLKLLSKKSADSTDVENFPTVLNESSACDISPSDTVEGACHCLVAEVDGNLVVHDLGGRGGTFVNGTRVTTATLRAGDTLSLNGTEFVVGGRPRAKRYVFGVRC